MKKYRIQTIAFLFQHMGFHCDASLPQIPDPFSCYQRIRIIRPNEHPPDPGLHNGLHTRRLLPVMAAWLQRYIQIRPLCRFCAGHQGISFCMIFTIPGMIAFSNDLSLLYDHSANQRIWTCPALSLFCQLYGPAHPFILCQNYMPPFAGPRSKKRKSSGI